VKLSNNGDSDRAFVGELKRSYRA